MKRNSKQSLLMKTSKLTLQPQPQQQINFEFKSTQILLEAVYQLEKNDKYGLLRESFDQQNQKLEFLFNGLDRGSYSLSDGLIPYKESKFYSKKKYLNIDRKRKTRLVESLQKDCRIVRLIQTKSITLASNHTNGYKVKEQQLDYWQLQKDKLLGAEKYKRIIHTPKTLSFEVIVQKVQCNHYIGFDEFMDDMMDLFNQKLLSLYLGNDRHGIWVRKYLVNISDERETCGNSCGDKELPKNKKGKNRNASKGANRGLSHRDLWDWMGYEISNIWTQFAIFLNQNNVEYEFQETLRFDLVNLYYRNHELQVTQESGGCRKYNKDLLVEKIVGEEEAGFLNEELTTGDENENENFARKVVEGFQLLAGGHGSGRRQVEKQQFQMSQRKGDLNKKQCFKGDETENWSLFFLDEYMNFPSMSLCSTVLGQIPKPERYHRVQGYVHDRYMEKIMMQPNETKDGNGDKDGKLSLNNFQFLESTKVPMECGQNCECFSQAIEPQRQKEQSLQQQNKETSCKYVQQRGNLKKFLQEDEVKTQIQKLSSISFHFDDSNRTVIVIKRQNKSLQKIQEEQQEQQNWKGILRLQEEEEQWQQQQSRQEFRTIPKIKTKQKTKCPNRSRLIECRHHKCWNSQICYRTEVMVRYLREQQEMFGAGDRNQNTKVEQSHKNRIKFEGQGIKQIISQPFGKPKNSDQLTQALQPHSTFYEVQEFHSYGLDFYTVKNLFYLMPICTIRDCYDIQYDVNGNESELISTVNEQKKKFIIEVLIPYEISKTHNMIEALKNISKLDGGVYRYEVEVLLKKLRQINGFISRGGQLQGLLQERSKCSLKLLDSMYPYLTSLQGYYKGIGIRNVGCEIPKGKFIGKFIGEILQPWREYQKQKATSRVSKWGYSEHNDGRQQEQQYERRQKNTGSNGPNPKQNIKFYCISASTHIDEPKGHLRHFTIDPQNQGNFVRGLNHSCDPNCRISVMVSSSDNPMSRKQKKSDKQLQQQQSNQQQTSSGQSSSSYCLAVYAIKNISKRQELTFDYMSITDSLEEYENAKCLCSSLSCMGRYLKYQEKGIDIVGGGGGILNEWFLEREYGFRKRIQQLVEFVEVKVGVEKEGKNCITGRDGDIGRVVIKCEEDEDEEQEGQVGVKEKQERLNNENVDNKEHFDGNIDGGGVPDMKDQILEQLHRNKIDGREIIFQTQNLWLLRWIDRSCQMLFEEFKTVVLGLGLGLRNGTKEELNERVNVRNNLRNQPKVYVKSQKKSKGKRSKDNKNRQEVRTKRKSNFGGNDAHHKSVEMLPMIKSPKARQFLEKCSTFEEVFCGISGKYCQQQQWQEDRILLLSLCKQRISLLNIKLSKIYYYLEKSGDFSLPIRHKKKSSELKQLKKILKQEQLSFTKDAPVKKSTQKYISQNHNNTKSQFKQPIKIHIKSKQKQSSRSPESSSIILRQQIILGAQQIFHHQKVHRKHYSSRIDSSFSERCIYSQNEKRVHFLLKHAFQFNLYECHLYDSFWSQPITIWRDTEQRIKESVLYRGQDWYLLDLLLNWGDIENIGGSGAEENEGDNKVSLLKQTVDQELRIMSNEMLQIKTHHDLDHDHDDGVLGNNQKNSRKGISGQMMRQKGFWGNQIEYMKRCYRKYSEVRDKRNRSADKNSSPHGGDSMERRKQHMQTVKKRVKCASLGDVLVYLRKKIRSRS